MALETDRTSKKQHELKVKGFVSDVWGWVKTQLLDSL